MDCPILFHIILFLSYFPCSWSLLLNPSNSSFSIRSSYDYIIVGGGLAGLVVSNRLTEDANVTVLVLEAGQLDSSSNLTTIPELIGHGWDPSYDWNITTTAQEFLDNQTRPYPVGHVVGGGTILNGLVMTRGSEADFNAWEILGNPGWGWRDMLPYFIKSETFVMDLDPQIASNLHIKPDMSVHGTRGPVEVTYPKFLYNQSSAFLQAVSQLGIPLLDDSNSGISSGAMIAPSSISSTNQSRVDSRTAYLDGAITRPNLHVAPGQTVTRILIDSAGSSPNVVVPIFGHLQRAYGVEFTNSSGSPRSTVNCTREVILSAGAVLSPILLQASGIGPSPILNDLDIPVKVDLVGVGQNLQDHGMVSAFYNYTSPTLFSTNNLTGATLLQAQTEYFTNHTGPLTTPLISTLAFPSLPLLLPNSNVTSILHQISTTPAPANLPPSLQKGYLAQRHLLLQLLRRPDIACLEIMADSIGTLTVALHRPFSRGTIRTLSSDPFGSPHQVNSNIYLNPRYCSQPEDCVFIIAGLVFTQRLVNTTFIQKLIPHPPFPWNGEGEVLVDAIKGNLRTEFHPCGTTSMLPFELGGVVSPRLMVYGMANLRVVDAGVMPLIPAAHLQAGVYAVAEKGADLIKEDWNSVMSGPGRELSGRRRVRRGEGGGDIPPYGNITGLGEGMSRGDGT